MKKIIDIKTGKEIKETPDLWVDQMAGEFERKEEAEISELNELVRSIEGEFDEFENSGLRSIGVHLLFDLNVLYDPEKGDFHADMSSQLRNLLKEIIAMSEDNDKELGFFQCVSLFKYGK